MPGVANGWGQGEMSVRALYFEDYGRMVLREVPDPVAADEVVVRVAACGICGSDLEGYRGSPGMRRRRVPPLLLGHEFSGTVEQGPEAWRGKAVAVNPLVSCGSCPRCREGQRHLCPARALIGLDRPGAFAERVAVPVRQLHVLPTGLPVWKGALAEPLAVATHAVALAEPGRARRALVLGGGAIGYLVAWVLARAGTEPVVVETNPARRAFLRGLGVEVGEDPGGQWELVVDTVGSEGSRRTGVERLAEGGTLVLLGLHDNATTLDLYPVILGERRLQGSYTYTDEDFQSALRLVASVPDEIVERRPLEAGPSAFEDLAGGRVACLKLMLVP